MTSTAVSDGAPPVFSEIPIAMPAVVDFGASERSVRPQQMGVGEKPDAGRHEEHAENGEDIVGEAPERIGDVADQRKIGEKENESDDGAGEREKPDAREDFACAQTGQNPKRLGNQHVASPQNRTPPSPKTCGPVSESNAVTVVRPREGRPRPTWPASSPSSEELGGIAKAANSWGSAPPSQR